MTGSPLVSVVIPYFNRAAWLAEAIASVHAQTFADWELVVVDDGSTEAFDLSGVVCDRRVLWLTQRNRGPAAARNAGMAAARGKYIAFLDADDLFDARKLEVQVRRMEAEPGVPLSHTSYWTISAAGERIGVVESAKLTGNVYPGIVSSCPIALPTVMVRAEAVQAVRFDERRRAGEDVMFWCRIARSAPILGIDEPLSSVRVHGKNAAHDPRIHLSANEQLLRDMMELDPSLDRAFEAITRSTIWSDVGSLYADQGQLLVAMRWFAKAIAERPTNRSVYKKLVGNVLRPRSILRRAMEAARRGWSRPA